MGSPAASPRSERTARARASTSSPTSSGCEDALAGADLVVTGEGKLDATSFAGKVVGGVLELAADADVGRRGVIAGQVTDEAREEASVLGDVTVLALTDRVWQRGRGVRTGPALL